jgi:hypothetical protein
MARENDVVEDQNDDRDPRDGALGLTRAVEERAHAALGASAQVEGVVDLVGEVPPAEGRGHDEERDQRRERLRRQHRGLLGALDLDEATQAAGAEVDGRGRKLRDPQRSPRPAPRR